MRPSGLLNLAIAFHTVFICTQVENSMAVQRVWGFRAPVVKQVPVSLDGWRGVRIAQLTDLHFGLVTPKALIASAVQTVNHERPDLVVLTGDFVCRGKRHLHQITEVLGALEMPAFAVLGNHDHWVTADGVRRALERAGVTVLQNSWAPLELNGRKLAVAGLDDSTTHNHDVDATLRKLDRPALGLTHNPAAAPLLWERGVAGVLSGHTHAGQVHVPGVTRRLYDQVLKIPYCDGMYATEDGWVYVSAGVGAGAIPWRGGQRARREVTLLEVA